MFLNQDFYITLHKYFITRKFDCSNRLNSCEHQLFRSKMPDFEQLYKYYSLKLEKQIVSQIYSDINKLINEVLSIEK